MPNSSNLSFQKMQAYERRALQLRELAGVEYDAPLDPFKLAEKMEVVIKYNQDFDPKDWSGGSKTMPNGQLFVLLNSNSTSERLNVTLLEEIAHHICNHDPTAIGTNGLDGYDEVQEQEAKFVAAAALIPSVIVGQVVWKRLSASRFASQYGASLQLFEMRVKTLNLWTHYKCEEEGVAA
jgi:Zn-dependent peptidase ImmA (M78 family)